MSLLTVMPAPNFEERDADGIPYRGGLLYTLATGGTWPTNALATYQDGAGLVLNANPVVLDSAGRAVVYLQNGQNYKLIFTTATGTVIWTRDPVSSVGVGVAIPASVPNGGTGQVSFTAGAILRGNGTGALVANTDLTFASNILTVNGSVALPNSGTFGYGDAFFGRSGTNEVSLLTGLGSPALAKLVLNDLNANTVHGNVTGNLTGNVTGSVTGNVTGNVSGSAGTVTSIATHASTELSDVSATIQPWTPVLEIGGISAGINYSLQSGFYVREGHKVTCAFAMTVTSLGAIFTGTAAISGFPLAPQSIQNTGIIVSSNVTNSPSLLLNTGTQTALILNRSTLAQLAFADFTTAFNLIGQITYFVT